MDCEDFGDEEEVKSTPMLIEDGGSSSKQPCIEAHSPSPKLEISIHALARSPSPQVMRIIVFIQGVRVVVLLDKGSTHNFVDPLVIAKARLQVDHTP